MRHLFKKELNVNFFGKFAVFYNWRWFWMIKDSSDKIFVFQTNLRYELNNIFSFVGKTRMLISNTWTWWLWRRINGLLPPRVKCFTYLADQVGVRRGGFFLAWRRAVFLMISKRYSSRPLVSIWFQTRVGIDFSVLPMEIRVTFIVRCV
jgi:hypothetical protein